MIKYPKYLYRPDDGVKFILQSNKKYIIDSHKDWANLRYEYNYSVLISHGFVDSIDKCKIVSYKSKNDGHGDIEDD